MIIHDISRDALTAKVYEGDPITEVRSIKSIENGDDYNLSAVSMCTHTGTHIDAPLHFDENGRSITDIRLNTFMGKCTVLSVKGILTGEDMDRLLQYCKRRILIHGGGKAFLSESAARVISESRVVLVGTDAPSIAPDFDEEKPHRILAEAEIAVLENLDLDGICSGEYELCAFPLKLSGIEAAPCRAILLEQEKGL